MRQHANSDSEEEQKNQIKFAKHFLKNVREDRDLRSGNTRRDPKFDYSFSSSSSDNEEKREAQEKFQR